MSSAATARPLVSVYGATGKKPLALPNVFLAPLRPDVVHHVHRDINKNKRQAYATNEVAGMQHSAESWGTGRAVARIPRVQNSGTAAFGNMCRKGRRFAPNKIWRKWHRVVNQNQRRFAVASALAASAVPSLVLARGHRVENIAEIPFIVADSSIKAIEKTKQAVEFLKETKVYDDVLRAQEATQMRAGRGKNRSRRFKERRGPLFVVGDNGNVTRALRNIEGIDIAHVDRLNLLALAPGGHLGRFIVWTESAFAKLDKIYGSLNGGGGRKTGFRLPRAKMTNADLGRIINSDEIQSIVRPVNTQRHRFTLKKNPLKNFGAMVKLNPYAMQNTRAELLHKEKLAKAGGAKKRKHSAATRKAVKATKKRRAPVLTAMLL